MTEEIKEILDKIDYVYDIQLDGTKEHQYMRDIRDYIINLQQENKYLEHIINNLKDNNNRLEKIIHDTDIVLEQENERLNNIINELEKYLEEQSTNLNRLSCSGHVYFMYQEDLNILNKLKELKENGNNE